MPRDNGFLNYTFLHRCRTIGYRHPKEIIEHYRNADKLIENSHGRELEYWKLSTSEQDRADRDALIAAGYEHIVAVPIDPNIRYHMHPDRMAMQTMLDNGHKCHHWTHVYANFNGESLFFFKDSTDAVQFRLTIP